MKFLVGAVREPPLRVDFNGKATVSGNRGNKRRRGSLGKP